MNPPFSSLRYTHQEQQQLNQLCTTAIQQQLERGEIVDQLRNRRRHLGKHLRKRLMPRSHYSSANLWLRSAILILATWGFTGLALPGIAQAEPVFGHSMQDGFGVGGYAIPALVDIDNDGDLDAFVGANDGTIRFFRNEGSASAPKFVAVTGTDNPMDGFGVDSYAIPTFVDIDNDGDLDAFVGASDGTIRFYLNEGSVSAAKFVAVTGTDNPMDGFDVGGYASPTFVDIDNDGDLDAFVGGGSGPVRFYRNDGSASAPKFVSVSGTDNPFNGVNVDYLARPVFVDIDKDGDLDAFIGAGYGTVKFYRNDGSASAPSFVAVSGTDNPLDGFDVGDYASAAIVDIDNDGDLDAFIGAGDGTISFYRNDGSASAPSFVAVRDTNNPLDGFDVGRNSSPTFIDIDKDGDLDAFIGANDGTARFYRNDGNASTPSFVAVSGTDNPMDGFDVGDYASPAFVDIDNDGDLDVFIGTYDGNVRFYRNDGSATAPNFVAVSGADNPLDGLNVGGYASPAFVDIDNDGDLDAFVGADDGTIRFYRNEGSASAPSFVAVSGTDNPLDGFDVGNYASPAFVDIDNDGDLDAFIGANDGTTRFYRNDGSASAPKFVAMSGADNPVDGFNVDSNASPTFVDINNDGDMDFFVGAGQGRIRFSQNLEVQRIPLATSGTVSLSSQAKGAKLIAGSLKGESVSSPPIGVSFPFGQISYQITTVAAGDTVTVRMQFSDALPTSLELHKVDKAGNYTLIPTTQWTKVDDNTVDLSLTDGGAFDLDGAANGVIEDPVAIGSNTGTGSGQSSGGGGGCTLNPRAEFDPLFPLLALFAGLWGWRRRKSGSN